MSQTAEGSCPSRRPLQPTKLGLGDSKLKSQDASLWQGVLESPAHFPAELFSLVVSEIVLHPEHNSGLILRADILSDRPGAPSSTELFEGFYPSRTIFRRLMPRRPQVDGLLEQECVFYVRYGEGAVSLLSLVPKLETGRKMPFYHPDVQKLAFLYTESSGGDGEDNQDGAKMYGRIRIEVVLAEESRQKEIDETSRLYRTCMALLEIVHRHGYGRMSGYKKRVHHDVVVERDSFQDLYLVLKERHKHHVSSWREKTDPLKHVFEVKKNALDVAIATFLMLLWKGAHEASTDPSPPLLKDESQEAPSWSTWGRPPGGFVDVGCGNGLLVHILNQEGYKGYGVDLHARKSWSVYGTGTDVRAGALDPLSLSPSNPSPFPAQSFLIGNHADELTPWIALLATLTPECAGFINIPCCPWELDRRFTRTRYTSEEGVETEVEKRMSGVDSRVKAYLVWIEDMARKCGWVIECEALRIPSTRNWALVGRKRVFEDGDSGSEADAKERVWDMIEEVRNRGIFKLRSREAKDNH